MRTATSSRDQSQLEGRSALRVGLAVATLALGALASGCGAGRDLRGSMRAYETGNFRRAEERCENIDEAELQGKVQVRYLVYCGLAYYKVGRQDAARERGA